jgi:hypothetical protein
MKRTDRVGDRLCVRLVDRDRAIRRPVGNVTLPRADNRHAGGCRFEYGHAGSFMQ